MTASQLYRLARPRTLTAAFSPVILGASYAATLHTAVQSLWLSLFYTLLILICVMSSQIAANIWNEYFDFKSGLDLNQAAGNSGTIVREGISPQQVKKLGSAYSTRAVQNRFRAHRSANSPQVWPWVLPLSILRPTPGRARSTGTS